MSEVKGSPPLVHADLRREGRCKAMMDAAEALFLERGFERTTLSAIVARSGGSLATLYDEFGNKQNLLHAVAQRMRNEAFSNFQGLDDEAMSPRKTLLQLAIQFHAFAMAPRSVSFMRVVVGHSLNDPEFGQAFHRDVRVSLVERLATSFRAWTEQGKAAIPDPTLAAELYLASVMCDAPLKAMMGAAPEAAGEETLAARLQPFLDHYRISDR